jgi:diketogulonate reductase-like aldo/keto reductase
MTSVFCEIQIFEDIYVSRSLSMPRNGFGTAGLQAGTKTATCNAILAGVRLIDTAQAPEWYSETGVGDAIRECLKTHVDDITVVTKIHPRSYMYVLNIY